MDPAGEFALRIEQVDGFQLRVRFDKASYAELSLDEPEPLGRDTGPNPARILAAAIGDCLSASLVFCLKRRNVAVNGLTADVHVKLGRNENKRLRVSSVHVTIDPHTSVPPAVMDACIATFEDFCVVTQSVREGIDVTVDVKR